MSASLRRLAAVPEPYLGESLLSWVDALASLNRVSRLQAMGLAAIIRPDATWHRPNVRFGDYLTAEAMDRIRITTGLSAERQSRMRLMHYADGVLPIPPSPLYRQTVSSWLPRLQLAMSARSRACPACLRENGSRWLLRWRLIWSFACVRHRVFLLGACRGCGKGLHQVLPGPGSAIMCGQYHWSQPSRACPRVIARMRPPRLSDEHLLECQRRLDGLIDDPHRAGGQDILRSLHLALEDIRIGYDDAPPLPDTDAVLHRRWRGHAGVLSYLDDPLLTAALIKIATVGGLGDSHEACAQAVLASWSAVGFPRLNANALSANRFGNKCRAIACAAWVPPGHGRVVDSQNGPHTLCPAHVGHLTVPVLRKTWTS
ncbi:TniQ family protein [Streptomyces longwoodensis]|uniref:TniQ family protein n=1 Tax=Streptomyces longwoodensis TaxID=68231 RepID=UPI0036FC4243